MRWRVLVVSPVRDGREPIARMLARAGIVTPPESVATRDDLLAALARCEWDLVLYDAALREQAPIELVYTHAPASAIVVIGDPADMADELARVVSARAELE